MRKLYWRVVYPRWSPPPPFSPQIPVHQALGILEVTGFTPAMVALDYMDKAGDITLLQTESNDFYGVVLKVQGSVANVSAAIAAGKAAAEQMQGKPVATIINRPDDRAWAALKSPPNPAR